MAGSSLDESLRIRNRWVAHQHDQGLAPDVEALEVVPAVLRCDHAVTDEDDLRVLDLRLFTGPARHGHEVLGKLELDCLSARSERSGDPRGLKSHEGDILDEGPIGIPRFQSHRAELAGQVGDGLVLARSSRSPALVLIRGQDLDVLKDRVGLDGLERILERTFARRSGAWKQDGESGQSGKSAGTQLHEFLVCWR